MHIPHHENHNKPIIDIGDADVPLTFFNTVRLISGVNKSVS